MPASHERSWQHSYTMPNSLMNFDTEPIGSLSVLVDSSSANATCRADGG